MPTLKITDLHYVEVVKKKKKQRGTVSKQKMEKGEQGTWSSDITFYQF